MALIYPPRTEKEITGYFYFEQVSWAGRRVCDDPADSSGSYV